jgi:hypothetical protein
MKFCMIAASLAAVAVAQTPVMVQAPMANPYFASRGYAGRGYGFPQQYGFGPRYVENIIEVPRPVPAPAVTSPAKTLAVADQLLTMMILGGNTGEPSNGLKGANFANTAANYYKDAVGDGYTKAPMAGSFLLNMMMLSQGLGGTGNNQMALYNVLNRNNAAQQQRYYKVGEGATTQYFKVDDGSVGAPKDISMGQDDAIMAMMNAGLGGMGMSAGSMFPILMYGQGVSALAVDAVDEVKDPLTGAITTVGVAGSPKMYSPTFNKDLMKYSAQFSGAW